MQIIPRRIPATKAASDCISWVFVGLSFFCLGNVLLARDEKVVPRYEVQIESHFLEMDEGEWEKLGTIQGVDFSSPSDAALVTATDPGSGVSVFHGFTMQSFQRLIDSLSQQGVDVSKVGGFGRGPRVITGNGIETRMMLTRKVDFPYLPVSEGGHGEGANTWSRIPHSNVAVTETAQEHRKSQKIAVGWILVANPVIHEDLQTIDLDLRMYENDPGVETLLLPRSPSSPKRNVWSYRKRISTSMVVREKEMLLLRGSSLISSKENEGRNGASKSPLRWAIFLSFRIVKSPALTHRASGSDYGS